MGKKPGKYRDFIIYFICSAAVVAAATFYFHVSDMKENSSTIIIERSTQATASSSEPSTETSTIKTTTSAVSAEITTTAVPETEYVYLDINSASHDELKKLKGIGDMLAEAIISYRNTHGRFRNIEEIMDVSGIGEGIFADICEHIYVVSPEYDSVETTMEEYAPVTEPETAYEPTLEELAPININTADISELMLLPHVDEETAYQIIKLRQDINGFGNTYELAYVENLSKSQVNDILPYVTIE